MINIMNLVDSCESLYSPLLGEITSYKICKDEIVYHTDLCHSYCFDKYGRFILDRDNYDEKNPVVSNEIMLFPSKTILDWSLLIDFKPGDFVEYDNTIWYVFKSKIDSDLKMIDVDGNIESITGIYSVDGVSSITGIVQDRIEFGNQMSTNNIQLMKLICKYIVKEHGSPVSFVFDITKDGLYFHLDSKGGSIDKTIDYDLLNKDSLVDISL